MRMEELHHTDMLENDVGLLRRHQVSKSSLVKGSSISRMATSSGFKLPKKSAVAWWSPRKKSVNNFHFPYYWGLHIFEPTLPLRHC